MHDKCGGPSRLLVGLSVFLNVFCCVVVMEIFYFWCPPIKWTFPFKLSHAHSFGCRNIHRQCTYCRDSMTWDVFIKYQGFYGLYIDGHREIFSKTKLGYSKILSFKSQMFSQEQWTTPVIPALGKLRQTEYHKFETSLGHIWIDRPAWVRVVRPCLSKQNFDWERFCSDLMNVDT